MKSCKYTEQVIFFIRKKYAQQRLVCVFTENDCKFFSSQVMIWLSTFLLIIIFVPSLHRKDGPLTSTTRCQHLTVSDEGGISVCISTISVMLSSSIVHLVISSQLRFPSKTYLQVLIKTTIHIL